ncbi:MAG: hypothetical protein VYE15_02835, partial [Myxococcota bacterium]|nr:hypothetical protein [Myxococcota bacterium]
MVTNTIEAFLILGLGFLGAQIVAHLVRRLLPIYGSVFFLTLGIVAGPLVMDVLSHEVLETSHWVISLLLAWVGLEVGLGLTVRRDGGLTEGAVRMGFIYGLVTLAILGASSYALVVYGFPEVFGKATPGLVAAAVAAAGLTGSPFVLRFVASRLRASGPVRESGESLVRVVRVVALLAF